MGIIIDRGVDKGETEREGGMGADQSGDNMMITFLWFPSKSKRHGWTYKKEAKEKKVWWLAQAVLMRTNLKA